MKVQRLLYLTSDLVANTFSGIFAPKRAHLSWCFAQFVSDVSQTKLLLCQDSSEILQSGI
ncbi:Secreted protein [Pseudomonas sp. IT-194MI4]